MSEIRDRGGSIPDYMKADGGSAVLSPATGQNLEHSMSIYAAVEDGRLKNATVYSMHNIFTAPYNEGVETLSTFFSGHDRVGYNSKPRSVKPIDANFSGMGKFMLAQNPDVLVVHASEYDGMCSLGGNADYSHQVRLAGKPTYVIINSNMPHVESTSFSPDDSNIVGIRHSNKPLFEVPPAKEPTETETRIVEHILSLCEREEEWDNIQVGVGGMPSRVLGGAAERGLFEKREGKKDRGIWSEVLTDPMVALGEAYPDMEMAGTLALGSGILHTFIDRNPRVRLLQASVTNNVNKIEEMNVLSVNQASLFSLLGATGVGVYNPEKDEDRYSGVGGQVDYARGARISVVANRSTHEDKKNGVVTSTIVPYFGPRDYIAIPPADRPTYFATEHGIAKLREGSAEDVVRNIITNCAHPDFQKQLWDDARRMGLL